MEQAFWTVLTGTLVFSFGKIVDSLCIQPYISYKKVIGEITYQLVFYANAYSSKMMKHGIQDEAAEKFRISAARLQTYFNPIAWMNLPFVPTRSEVDEATAQLIGLSNGIPPRDKETRENSKRANTIRKTLRIKFYE